MAINKFTYVMGVLFVALGVLGFIPALVTPPTVFEPGLVVESAHGLLFGLFPVNTIHNLLHLAFGVWGLWAASQVVSSTLFCRTVAWIYLILTVAGLIPGVDTLFGLVPLYGHNIWLHGLITLATAYFGYVWHPSTEPKVSPSHLNRPSTRGV